MRLVTPPLIRLTLSFRLPLQLSATRNAAFLLAASQPMNRHAATRLSPLDDAATTTAVCSFPSAGRHLFPAAFHRRLLFISKTRAVSRKPRPAIRRFPTRRPPPPRMPDAPNCSRQTDKKGKQIKLKRSRPKRPGSLQGSAICRCGALTKTSSTGAGSVIVVEWPKGRRSR